MDFFEWDEDAARGRGDGDARAAAARGRGGGTATRAGEAWGSRGVRLDEEMREVMMASSSAVMMGASGGVETEEGVGGGDETRRRAGTPRPLYGKALTKRIKELGDMRRLGDVFALLDASAIPTTPNGRKITIGAVVGA